MSGTTQRFFDARPESAGEARAFAAEALAGWGLSDRVEDIRLCVSELATNALVHGTAPGHGFLVRLDVDGEAVRLEVHDSRHRHPEARRAADTDVSGRGLTLVAALADDWGVQDRTPIGKVVWSLFKDTGGAAAMPTSPGSPPSSPPKSRALRS
ncbi:ATP-binding protein [Streptomyces antibioticus]|uniref:ATP-binding protein n=1 Tax=Streptomyces antibioticus TaxID=1890 RepID=UPI0022543AFF|nr:ATP-binding protein [Streptomyces antibioticus]MCX5169721.1 ATP-binding protein [Streptomyces antibioticus]